MGHVFQGRYKAIVVQKDTHLLELCRYVVLNPVRAGLVETAADWPWSNYRAMTWPLGRRPTWLNVAWTLSQFGTDLRKARRAYCRFVAEGVGHQPWQELSGQIYYGDETFIAGLPAGGTAAEIPRVQRQPLRLTLADVVKSGTPEEIGQAYREHGYRLKEIAHQLKVHYSTVSRRLKRYKARQSV